MAKQGLGRGLDHLFEQTNSTNQSGETNQEVVMIDVAEIKPNPYQPRKHFDQEQLEELAESIKTNGVFQPILVRPNILGYEIISGERRFRASEIAGLESIPAIIYKYDDKQMMEVALIENIQREDLNPVEEAASYKQLMENLGYTQEKLSERIGKSRSHISNLMRLLNLNDEMLKGLETGKISLGHAKILVGIKEDSVRQKMYQLILDNELSVRETEALLSEVKNKANKEPQIKEKTTPSSYGRLEGILKDKLGTKIQITGKDKGQIKINYTSEADLERLLEILNII